MENNNIENHVFGDGRAPELIEEHHEYCDQCGNKSHDLIDDICPICEKNSCEKINFKTHNL